MFQINKNMTNKILAFSFIFFFFSYTNIQAQINISGTVLNNNNCGNGPTGKIDITVSGGVSPYTYVWSNGKSTEDIDSLSAGFYGVNVTDQNGATGVLGFQVVDVPGMSLTDQSVYPSCAGQLGEGVVSVSGGNPPYTFQWSNGDLDSTAENLAIGNYKVWVTDATGCKDSLSISITNNPALQVYPIPTHALCHSDSGKINLFITGGTGNYQIDWDGIDSTAVPPGNHTVKVTDNSGCEKQINYTINSQPEIIASVNTQIIDCDTNLYAVTANVSGGNPPYTFNWTLSDTNAATAGNYELSITDASSCQKIVPFVIDTGSAINIQYNYTPINCSSTTTNVTISIAGGNAPYQIIWSDSTKNTFTNEVQLSENNSVTVIDSRNCEKTVPIEIIPVENIQIAFNLVEPTCGDANGAIGYQISGGTTNNYTVKINETEVFGNNYINVDSGIYKFEVTEPGGCSFDTIITYENNGGVYLITHEMTHNTCASDSKGSISTKFYSDSDISFKWSNGDSTSSLKNLAGGAYELTVTDEYGCTWDSIFIVEKGTQILASSTIFFDPCVDDEGYIKVFPSGGTPPYDFKWQDEETEQQLTITETGYYEVMITDSNGCSGTFNFYAEGNEIGGNTCFKIPTGFSPNGDGINDQFEIVGNHLFQESTLRIFDRWGKLIYEKYNYQGDWDGTIDGSPAEAGSYIYIYETNNQKNDIFKGTISIKR